MSTRLNTNLRGAIVANALAKAGIVEAETARNADYQAWVEDLRVHLLGVPEVELLAMERKAIKAAAAIPEHLLGSAPTLLRRNVYFEVNLAGANLMPWMYDANGDEEKRIVPRGRPAVTADNPLVQRFYDLEARKEALNAKRADLRAQVRAILNSVTTVKALLKAWPEAKELLPENLEEAKAQLPALVVADLNAMIGLPTEQAA